MAEVVLAFATGGFAEMDGVLGAVVIAGHAVGAMTLPTGSAVVHHDVMQLADFGTFATTDAVVIDMELLVGYQHAVEHIVDEARFECRHRPGLHVDHLFA